MIDPWLLWIASILSLAALLNAIRLQRAVQRHQREVYAKLALLARAAESVRGKASLLGAGLTPDEMRALENLKRRQLARTRRLTSSSRPNRLERDPPVKG